MVAAAVGVELVEKCFYHSNIKNAFGKRDDEIFKSSMNIRSSKAKPLHTVIKS